LRGFLLKNIAALRQEKKGGGIFAASPQGKKEKFKTVLLGSGRLGAGGG
jgi:hypothetical protein